MDSELQRIRRSDLARRLPRIRQRLGKYRIERVLGEGGFATVYHARDTIEGIPVALKVFRNHIADNQILDVFRQEARLHAKLDHPNILTMKDANVIDGHFVIVTRMGSGTLADRLARRMAMRTALHFAEEILCGLAHAHENRVIHLDVKPENFILFPNETLKLTDFGIARLAQRTIQGSGSGTVGYTAPEQAMGRPSARSDVFSAGLLLWRLFAGKMPEWPFEEPHPGHDKIRRALRPDFVEFLTRSIAVAPSRRFADAVAMLETFQRLAPRALQPRRPRKKRVTSANGRHWREVRWKQFLREYRKVLDVRQTCPGCGGPVAETMLHCPWCCKELKVHRGETRMARRCTRCKRGMKPDWRFCAFCFGKGFAPTTSREYDDARYQGRCSNHACGRKDLMPFMRYCPWCRTKVRRKWTIPENRHKCSSCGWGVLRDFWSHCPWCSKSLRK